MPHILAQVSSWLGVKDVSGEVPGGLPVLFLSAFFFFFFSPGWLCRERALKILCGEQVLADLTVAISALVRMAKLSVAAPAVPGPRFGGSCCAPCPSPEAAEAGVHLQNFSNSSALHLTLSVPWQEKLSSILTVLSESLLSWHMKLRLQWDARNSCK